ncbi:MAG: hypothetical protein IKK51_05030 [Oscillospiraceae bacterium]|nr:hypothetical protein [Oscillospiraceae bacterium]MBR4101225.1 hypothetical protein [Oscillospiraceae bacterium]MBR6617075.1 hypothetical protein [Oscillospiraceae bacterium]
MAKNKKAMDGMDEAYRLLEEAQRDRRRDKNDLLTFFLGLLMFAGGVFMILQNIIVRTSWGTSFYHIGSWAVPNGMIMLPVLIGIVMLFVMEKRIFGWIVFVLGLVFILLTIIMSVQISWKTSNAYMFLMMFGLAAAGGGLLMKVLFRKN